MGHIGMTEFIVILTLALLKFGIPIAFAIWVIIAIKRIVDGVKRVSARLDAIEKMLMDKQS